MRHLRETILFAGSTLSVGSSSLSSEIELCKIFIQHESGLHRVLLIGDFCNKNWFSSHHESRTPLGPLHEANKQTNRWIDFTGRHRRKA